MTKKFTINCDFGGQMSPFAIFIGKPEEGHHPLHFQADWLSKARGGMIPGEVMEAVTQLQELAKKNGVALEDLCVYALGTEKQQSELESASGGTSIAEISDNPIIDHVAEELVDEEVVDEELVDEEVVDEEVVDEEVYDESSSQEKSSKG